MSDSDPFAFELFTVWRVRCYYNYKVKHWIYILQIAITRELCKLENLFHFIEQQNLLNFIK